MKKLKLYFDTAIVFIKTLIQLGLVKLNVASQVVVAFIKNPFDWRENLIPENKAYDDFIKGRKAFIEANGYSMYVKYLMGLFGIAEGKTFKLPNGSLINITRINFSEHRGQVLFNGTDHLNCTFQYIEGICGVSSNKQADMRQALSLMGFIKLKTDRNHKPTKIKSVVPFYGKTRKVIKKGKEVEEIVPTVLINDDFIVCHDELNKMVPGYDGEDIKNDDYTKN